MSKRGANQDLAEGGFWLQLSSTAVPGDVRARRWTSDDEVAGRIKDFQTVAVLQVKPVSVDFRLGYKSGGQIHIGKNNIDTSTDGRFRVKIGDDSVVFFAQPLDLESQMSLGRVTITTLDDNTYDDLPIYTLEEY